MTGIHAASRIGNAIKKILRLAGDRANVILCLIDCRFTPLALLVAGIVGTAIIFVAGSLNRYNKFDWWNWRRRATWSSARLWALLLFIKGGLKIIK